MRIRSALIAVWLAGCAAPVVDTGDTASGPTAPERLFADHCTACHGDDGRGTAEGPDLVPRLADQSPVETALVITRGTGFMPPVDLAEADAAALAVWVHAWLAADRR